MSLLLPAEACLQPRRAAADLRARSLHGKAARPLLGHCVAGRGETMRYVGPAEQRSRPGRADILSYSLPSALQAGQAGLLGLRGSRACNVRPGPLRAGARSGIRERAGRGPLHAGLRAGLRQSEPCARGKSWVLRVGHDWAAACRQRVLLTGTAAGRVQVL